MSASAATITIELSPFIQIGPISLAWHGLMTAAGLIAGSWLAARYAKERGLDREQLITAVAVLTLAGMVGARFYFLAQEDSAALLRPGDWFGTTGYAFYGALMFGTAAAAVYFWRTGLGARYLDALAAGFPLGMAVGRMGDVINGEHYGPPTEAPWGFRYTHPDAEAPGASLAYHSGAFYEVLLALAMLAAIWPLRHRFKRPTTLLWTVIAIYALGRFAIFFVIRDTEIVALGLRQAQWTSLGLMAVAAAGLAWARRGKGARSGPEIEGDPGQARLGGEEAGSPANA